MTRSLLILCVILLASSFVSPIWAETDSELCDNAFKAKKYKEAYPACLKAAKSGNVSAEFNLAEMYGNGNGVKADKAEALMWLRKAADHGYAKAQYRLGFLLAAGELVKQDFEEAMRWFLKSAEQGNVDAQHDVGFLYERGLGVEFNLKEAERWYRMAAEQGHSRSEYKLGSIIYSDKFNLDGALVWYRKAAEHGSMDAMMEMATKFEAGTETRQDYSEAFNWYYKAALLGNILAQEKLGEAYRLGLLGQSVNWISAVSWYGKAARGGSITAEISLGDIAAEQKIYSQAAKHYLKLAETGYTLFQLKLGLLYDLGLGVPKNDVEAVKWFRHAAEKGDTAAQHYLAVHYANGEGIALDNIQAFAWSILASTGGDENYKKLYQELEQKLNKKEHKLAQQFAARYQSVIDHFKNPPEVDLAQFDSPVSDDYRLYYGLPINRANSASINRLKVDKVHPPLSLPTPTKPVFSTNDIAIIIGIEKYRSVPPTEYAAADASMVRDYLKTLGIPERNIEFLADDRATLSDIRKVIETKLPNMVKANSRVIVYYAGHGAPGTARGESYLVPYDGDPSFLADTAYPLSRLYDRLSRLNAKEVLVILDSCFSGAGGRSVLAKNTRPLVMVKDTPPPASKKMIVMTSSRGSQITTSLSEVGHGAFTYFFLRALQEGNRDIGEVYAYLNPRVTEEAKRQNVDQTPTISPTADKLKGRFLFAR